MFVGKNVLNLRLRDENGGQDRWQSADLSLKDMSVALECVTQFL
jgi:hypothetical protein